MITEKEYNTAEAVLNCLRIPYTRVQSCLADFLIDTPVGSVVELSKLLPELSTAYTEYLMTTVFMEWFLGVPSSGPFGIGVDSNNKFLPFNLRQPFSEKESKSFYKWHGLPVTPCDMILTNPCDPYIVTAERLYRMLSSREMEIMRAAIMYGSSKAMDILHDRFNELKSCFIVKEVT